MDQQRIKELIDLVADSDLSELTLSENGTTLTLTQHLPTPVGAGSARDPAPTPAPAPTPTPPPPPTPTQTTPPASPPTTTPQVCSPLYGILHLTPSPDEPPFVTLGATVSAGQTLCIVEAMKMFHQVKATQAGRIDAILAQAGAEVESGQPLFSLV